MSNYQYPWEEIFQDCADLITVQIRDSKNVPETFPQLYQLFEKWYTERGKKVPEQRHFIRKMREELGVESGKKKIQPYLYAFVGKYDKMSLELLAEGTTLSRVSNASWLFVRLRSKISSTTDKKNAHFYYLSRKLKEKFPQDILFLSFDVDTLVILCKDEESKIGCSPISIPSKRSSLYERQKKRTKTQV